ncbi:MAG: hypothetical protein ABJO45_12715 [Lentilitoribacter sp.]
MLTQLSAQKLIEIEEEIAKDDLQNIRSYYVDAIKFHNQNNSELRRRRKKIGDTDVQVGDTFYGFGLLSALLDSRKGWDMAIKELGVDIDPGFGFLAYRYVCQYRSQTDQPKTWKFTLEQASDHDHLPSKWLLMKQANEASDVFLVIARIPQFIHLIIRFKWLSLKNPKDRRLATYP